MKTRLTLCLIVLLSFVLNSCNRTEFPQPPDKGDAYIYINIANNDLTPATKGLPISGVDNLQENLLQSLYILMYNITRGERLLGEDFYVQPGDPNWVSDMVGIERTALNDFDPNDSIQVFVVANISEDAQRAALRACNNVQDVYNLLEQYEYGRHLSLSGAYYEPADSINARPFLMEANNKVLMNMNRYPFVTLSLKRLSVKIKIQLSLDRPLSTGGQNDPDFNRWIGQDMQYTVVNTPSVARLIQIGRPCDAADRDYTSTTYRAFHYQAADSTDASVFYALENEWQSLGSQETYLRLNIPYYNDQNQRVDSNYYKIRLNEAALCRNDFYLVEVVIRQLGSSKLSDPVELQNAGLLLIEDWNQSEMDVAYQNDYIRVSATQNEFYGAWTYFWLSTARTPVFEAYFMPSNGSPEPDAAMLTITDYLPEQNNRVDLLLADTLPRFTHNKQLMVDIQAGLLKKTIEFDCYPASVFFRDSEGIEQANKLLTLAAEAPFAQIAEAVESDGRTSETAVANQCLAPSIQISSQIHALTNAVGNQGAAQYCEDYTEDGFDDWRVPTMAEMQLIRLARVEALSRMDTLGILRLAPFWGPNKVAAATPLLQSSLPPVLFEPYVVPPGAKDLNNYVSWEVFAGDVYVLPEGNNLSLQINMATNTKYYIAGNLTITGIWGSSALFVVAPTGSITFAMERMPTGMTLHNHGDQVLPGTFTIGSNASMQVKGDLSPGNLSVEGSLYVQEVTDGGTNLVASGGSYIRFGKCAFFSGNITLTNNATLISETCLTANNVYLNTNASLHLESQSILECNNLELSNATCEVNGGSDSYAVINVLGTLTVHHSAVDEMFTGLLDIHCDDIVGSGSGEMDWADEVIFNGDTYIPATDCRDEFGTPPDDDKEPGFFSVDNFPLGNYWTAQATGTASNYYALPIPSGNAVSIAMGQSAYVRCVRSFQ